MKPITTIFLGTTFLCLSLIIHGFMIENGACVLLGFASLSWLANIASGVLQDKAEDRKARP
jgi:uncharacterized membrane protein